MPSRSIVIPNTDGLLDERTHALAVAFDDRRRSMAITRLAALLKLALVTDEELSGFSAPTRHPALGLAPVSRVQPNARRTVGRKPRKAARVRG